MNGRRFGKRRGRKNENQNSKKLKFAENDRSVCKLKEMRTGEDLERGAGEKTEILGVAYLRNEERTFKEFAMRVRERLRKPLNELTGRGVSIRLSPFHNLCVTLQVTECVEK